MRLLAFYQPSIEVGEWVDVLEEMRWMFSIDFNLCVYMEQLTCNYLGITTLYMSMIFSVQKDFLLPPLFWLTARKQLIKVWINISNLHFYSCIMNTYRRQQPTPVSCLIMMVVSQALQAAGISTHPLWCYGCFSVLGPQLENVFSFLNHLAFFPSGLSRPLEQSPSCPL